MARVTGMENSYSPTEGAVPIGRAAEMIGVSVSTLLRWEKEGRVKASRTLGGQRRFEHAEIERVKAEMRAAS